MDYSLKSTFWKSSVLNSGRLSDSGTNVGLPCGLSIYWLQISLKRFLPMAFSKSVMVFSSRGFM